MIVQDADGVHQINTAKCTSDHAVIPPLIHSMTQATLDHLPYLLSVVLKCGSVMGTRFSTDDVILLLPCMMPSHIEVGRSQIQAELLQLQQMKIINSAVDERQASHTGDRDRRRRELRNEWEVSGRGRTTSNRLVDCTIVDRGFTFLSC